MFPCQWGLRSSKRNKRLTRFDLSEALIRFWETALDASRVQRAVQQRSSDYLIIADSIKNKSKLTQEGEG